MSSVEKFHYSIDSIHVNAHVASWYRVYLTFKVFHSSHLAQLKILYNSTFHTHRKPAMRYIQCSPVNLNSAHWKWLSLNKIDQKNPQENRSIHSFRMILWIESVYLGLLLNSLKSFVNLQFFLNIKSISNSVNLLMRLSVANRADWTANGEHERIKWENRE